MVSVPTNVKNSLAAAAEDARVDAELAMPTCLKLAGPESPGAGAPELGEPFPIIRLGLDRLKELGSNRQGDNGSLVHFLPAPGPGSARTSPVVEVLYPVLVGAQLSGSVTLEQQQNGDWTPTVYNNLGVTQALFDAKQARQARKLSENERYTGISVRALGLYFLGVLLDKGDLFVPLANDPDIGFEKGVPVPAEQALATLSKLANSYNGLPG